MFRVDNATASPSLNTPDVVGPNPDGYFTNGDSTTATPATVVDDDWCNAVQEEICYPITQAGMTLDKTSRTQLKSAMHIFAQKDTGVYALDTGAANAYVVTLSPVPAAYTTGMRLSVKIVNANTTTSTINVNGLGVKTIKDLSGANLAANALLAGMMADLKYDGTNFQLCNSPLVTTLDWATKAQVQSGELVYAASTSSPNTFTASCSPALTTYTTGMKVRIKFTNANTGAATLNLNSLGAKNIKRDDGAALSSGDIAAGSVCEFIYDGTNMVLDGLKVYQFAKTAATSGYQKLPSGIIIQWGNCTIPSVAATESQVAVSFPLAFPNAVFSITTSYNGATGVGGPAPLFNHMSTAYNTVTVSGFNFYGDTGGGSNFTQSVAGSWIAIGN